MTNIRRYFRENDIIFVTHVSHNRKPILVANFDLLWKAIETTKQKTQFDLIAWAILPDHFHMIVDPKKNNLSALMKSMKLSFSWHYRQRIEMVKGRVWQNRFWAMLSEMKKIWINISTIFISMPLSMELLQMQLSGNILQSTSILRMDFIRKNGVRQKNFRS